MTIKYLSILFSITIIHSSFSCTLFNATTGDTTLIGYNEDWGCDKTHVVFYPPANGKYGRVYFGCDNEDFGGMNDQGLYFGECILTKRDIAFPTNKPFYPGYIWYSILDSCADVEEAIEMIEQYNIESLEESHFMIVDKSGASAIIEWGESDLSIIRKEGNYQLMTNFNITDPSLAGWYPCWRYETADQMLKENNFSVEHSTSILEAVHQEGDDPTQYSVVYDLYNFEIYVYYYHNYDKVIILDFNKELSEGYHLYELSTLFTNVGLLSPNESKVSRQFQLFKNYPNPFTVSTRLSYVLLNPDIVTLKIYNIIGQEIQTVVNELQPAGDCSIDFTADNLPGGVYIAKLEVGDNIQSKKIQLIK